jgi:hypothetical protein
MEAKGKRGCPKLASCIPLRIIFQALGGGPLRASLICYVGKASEPEALGQVEALLAL